MEYHKYSLAKKGKAICPACKHKSYVLYLDNATGEPLHSTVGKCDRADNCGHHYSPKEYFRDNNISFDKKEYAPVQALKANLLSMKPQPSYIDESIFKKSLRGYENNQFVKWLSGIVGEDAAMKAIEMYHVGTSKNNGTCFWQIDTQSKIRAGKIIQYDSNGHRRKDVAPPVQWVHSLLKLPNFNLKQCFFGEELLRDVTKMVAIVESEKTAIVGSIYLPDIIWLACGGSEGLSIEKCQVLKGRDVVLYPDVGMFSKWSEKAKELSKFCNVRVSDLIETKATDAERQAGYDIADYLIKFPLSDFAEEKPLINPNGDMKTNEQPVIKRETSDYIPYYAIARRRDDWTSEIQNIEKWFATATLPTLPFRLSVCETISDCKLFVEAILLMAKSNNGNPAFRPYLDRLITFKNKLST